MCVCGCGRVASRTAAKSRAKLGPSRLHCIFTRPDHSPVTLGRQAAADKIGNHLLGVRLVDKRGRVVPGAVAHLGAIVVTCKSVSGLSARVCTC